MIDTPSSPNLQAQPVVDGERANPAIVCVLPPEEIPDRVDEWRQVLTHVRARQRAGDGGLRLQLADTVPLDDLTRLAMAEQGCCSFFSFTITVDARGVALEVRAPDHADDLVTAAFGEAA